MSNPYVGEIRLVPFNFAPVGWAFCDGQILPISQNTALFSLLGVFYGGDGKSNFALPNLQGNVIVGMGQGPGLENYEIGETEGAAAVNLTVAGMPSHNHTIPASSTPGHGSVPGTASILGSGGRGNQPAYATPATQMQSPAIMAGAECGSTGGSQPHNNLMPYQALNYIIAMQGVYPPRP
jgi:microcystin-dependent protein